VDADATVQHASEGVAGVVNLQVVAVQSRGVVQNACHLKCRSDVRGADQDVALTTTGCLRDSVSFTLQLEVQTLELFNRPTTVGVDVKVEHASGSSVSLSTRSSADVDGADDLAVDFCQDFGGQDVGQLSLSVQTVDSL